MGVWGNLRKALGGKDAEAEPQRFPDEYRKYEERLLHAPAGSKMIPEGLSERITGIPGSAARREWARSSFDRATRPIEPADGRKPDSELLHAIDAEAVRCAVHMNIPIAEAVNAQRDEVAGFVKDLMTRPAGIDQEMRSQADGLMRGSWTDSKRDEILGSGEVVKAPMPPYSLDEGASRRRWGEESLLLRTEAARAGLLTAKELVAVASHTSTGRDTVPVDHRTIDADFVPKPPIGQPGPDRAYLQQVTDETLRKRFAPLPGIETAVIPPSGGDRAKWIDSSLRGLKVVDHIEASNPEMAARVDEMRRHWAVAPGAAVSGRGAPTAGREVPDQERIANWDGKSLADLPMPLIDHDPEYARQPALRNTVPEAYRGPVDGATVRDGGPGAGENSEWSTSTTGEILAIDKQGQALLCRTTSNDYLGSEGWSIRSMPQSKAFAAIDGLRAEAAESSSKEPAIDIPAPERKTMAMQAAIASMTGNAVGR